MKKFIIIKFCVLISTVSFAQQDTLSGQPSSSELQQTLNPNEDSDPLKNLSVSGYIQVQFQLGQKDASLKVGASNEDKTKNFNRIGIRRGRLKFAYTKGIGSVVYQIDLTENGFGLKDAYLKLTDSWMKSISVTVGVFNRPFGYEIENSSSKRESIERSTIFQTLFPEERDLGVQFTLQSPKTASWHILRLDAGLFTGNGIKTETDSRKDFIGRLSIHPSEKSNLKWSAGISYYSGGVYQGSKNIYKMNGNGFILDSDSSNIGHFAKREYLGADAQLQISTKLGTTKINSEYLFGTQPGIQVNSKSPNASALPQKDVYVRKFRGAYVMLVQEIRQFPLSAVLKYEWYNPNTQVKGNDIGLNNTDIGDIAYYTTGVGILWNIMNNFILTCYYEIVRNETADHLNGYDINRKDNIFSLRLQYKF